MSFWRTSTAGLRKLVRKDAAEADLADELRHYLAMATEDNIRKGMAPDEATRAARIRIGSLEAAKAEVRASGWEGFVDGARQDLTLAVRGLRRSRAFTLTAILSLALGIGAITTMFSLINAVLWRPLPYADGSRLALIWTDDARRGLHREPTAYATITDWQAQNHAFTDLAYFSTQRVAPVSNDPNGGRGRSRSALVSANLFHVLGVAPLKGRLLTSADELDRVSVAVITHGFWQRWFSGADDVIGKTLAIDDASKGGLGTLTVVGVLPAGFYFPDKLTEIYTPATTYWRFSRESTERFPSWARRWTAIGRLASGTSVAGAQESLNQIGRQLAAAHPSTVPDFPGFATTVVPVLDSIAGTRLQSSLWMLLAAMSAVLLVVCGNLANLLLARTAACQREFAVQMALGAGRGRVIRQLLSESFVLVIAGGILGTAVAVLTTPWIASQISAYVPRMDEVALDVRVLLFAFGTSLGAGFAFAAVPALRGSAAHALDALRQGVRGTATPRLRRSQNLLIFAECVLALVLLTCAGLLLKSLYRLHAVEPGFDPAGVLTVRIEFPLAPPPTPEERRQDSTIAPAKARARDQALHELIQSIATLPAVSSAAVTDDLYVAGQGNESITIPGRPTESMVSGELNEAAVTPTFFATMRVPLRRGRYPSREDAAQKIRALWTPVVTHLPLAEKERRAIPEPVVVNEAFVTRFFAGEDPIGKRFCVDPTNKTYWYEIVGVVGNMHRGGLERTSIPEYYGPYIPSPNGRVDLVVRTTGDPQAPAKAVRAEILRMMPSVAIPSISTADAQLAAFSAQRRLQTWLLAGFALLAVMLAGVGIFGLTHYAVTERTHEIGIRMTIGATPADILRLLVGEGVRVPLLGIGVGLVASMGLGRLIESQLFEVTASDPGTFVGVAGVLFAVAAAASLAAAIEASRVNPMRAMKTPS
jgi:putative ABC transport system permease protein